MRTKGFFARNLFFKYFLITVGAAILSGAIVGVLLCEIEDYFSQKEYRFECMEEKVSALENCRVFGGFAKNDRRLCSGEELE